MRGFVATSEDPFLKVVDGGSQIILYRVSQIEKVIQLLLKRYSEERLRTF